MRHFGSFVAERARPARASRLWPHRSRKRYPTSTTARCAACSAPAPTCAATTTCGVTRSTKSSSRTPRREGTSAAPMPSPTASRSSSRPPASPPAAPARPSPRATAGTASTWRLCSSPCAIRPADRSRARPPQPPADQRRALHASTAAPSTSPGVEGEGRRSKRLAQPWQGWRRRPCTRACAACAPVGADRRRRVAARADAPRSQADRVPPAGEAGRARRRRRRGAHHHAARSRRPRPAAAEHPAHEPGPAAHARPRRHPRCSRGSRTRARGAWASTCAARTRAICCRCSRAAASSSSRR